MDTQEKIGHLDKQSGNPTARTGRAIDKETQPRVGHLQTKPSSPATRRTDTVKGA